MSMNQTFNNMNINPAMSKSINDLSIHNVSIWLLDFSNAHLNLYTLVCESDQYTITINEQYSPLCCEMITASSYACVIRRLDGSNFIIWKGPTTLMRSPTTRLLQSISDRISLSNIVFYKSLSFTINQIINSSMHTVSEKKACFTFHSTHRAFLCLQRGLQRENHERGGCAPSWIFDRAQRTPCRVCLMLSLEIYVSHGK